MALNFNAALGTHEPRSPAQRIAQVPYSAARRKHLWHCAVMPALRTLLALLCLCTLTLASQISSKAHAQGLNQPFREDFKAYYEDGMAMSKSRSEVAISYVKRLTEARIFMRKKLENQRYTEEGQAFVDFFRYDGDIQDASLIGENAWERWGQWGISARYCDKFLLVYYRSDVEFKSGLTASDILFAPWIDAVRRNETRTTAKYINIAKVYLLDWVVHGQVLRQHRENVDIPECIRNDYFSEGPYGTIVSYSRFELDHFPHNKHVTTEYRTLECDAGDIGKGKKQRRRITRWRTPKNEYVGETEYSDWVTVSDCHPPMVQQTYYSDQCWASAIGMNGKMVTRVWSQHVVEVPDPASEGGTTWALSDPYGNIAPLIAPTLFYSLCDDNTPPVITSMDAGPKSSVTLIDCDDRHERPYRPEVPWSGDITRNESWDETIQTVPFDQMSELRIRKNIEASEVDTCRRELIEDEDEWEFSTEASCAHEGVKQLKRKTYRIYEDVPSTGPHVDTSTMQVIGYEYGEWEQWRNDCYQTKGSTDIETRNAACGTGHSGHIVEQRDVTYVSTHHEQLHIFDRVYDTTGPWVQIDNHCYYDVTDTWTEEQLDCWRAGTPYMHPAMYTRQQRTLTHKWRIFEDYSKGTQDLGLTTGPWYNVSKTSTISTDFPLPNDEAWEWRQQNCRFPAKVGDVTPSHPDVSPSGKDEDFSIDVNGDGLGDYTSIKDAIENGYDGKLRTVNGGCGPCNGPHNGGPTGDGNDSDEAGNGGGGFWDKVKDFFGF